MKKVPRSDPVFITIAEFQGKDDVIVTDKIELYCDADRRAGIPQEELEKYAPTLGECMEAYHEQGL